MCADKSSSYQQSTIIWRPTSCLFSYFRTISQISAVARKWIIIFPAKYLTFPLFGQSAQTNASSAIYCAYNNTEAVFPQQGQAWQWSWAAGREPSSEFRPPQHWHEATLRDAHSHCGHRCFALRAHGSSTRSVSSPPSSALFCWHTHRVHFLYQDQIVFVTVAVAILHHNIQTWPH